MALKMGHLLERSSCGSCNLGASVKEPIVAPGVTVMKGVISERISSSRGGVERMKIRCQ